MGMDLPHSIDQLLRNWKIGDLDKLSLFIFYPPSGFQSLHRLREKYSVLLEETRSGVDLGIPFADPIMASHVLSNMCEQLCPTSKTKTIVDLKRISPTDILPAKYRGSLLVSYIANMWCGAILGRPVVHLNPVEEDQIIAYNHVLKPGE
jgi:hypothetical protein